MKKGIELYSDYDAAGRWVVHISKRKGRFTLDEIRDALTEYMQDIYMVVIKAMDMEYDDEPEGDYVECYIASEVMR
jgi:hypothetical protein